MLNALWKVVVDCEWNSFEFSDGKEDEEDNDVKNKIVVKLLSSSFFYHFRRFSSKFVFNVFLP